MHYVTKREGMRIDDAIQLLRFPSIINLMMMRYAFYLAACLGSLLARDILGGVNDLLRSRLVGDATYAMARQRLRQIFYQL